MDSEKIKKLAREYRQHANYPFEDMTEAKLVAMDVIKWLSETHCIVEKDKLKEEYEHNSEMYDLGCVVPATMGHVHKGKMELLEMLFGKELFNEAEK